jgi:hypothetical protein
MDIPYDSQYDESEELLPMGIIITIPDRFTTQDQAEFTQSCMVLIEKFQKYYELSIQFLNNKKRNRISQ